MDARDTIIYVSQKAQTVLGHGKATPMGIPHVRPQSDMRCYMLDQCDLESGSWQHRQGRISNNGSFDVGGYLVGGFSHEALGGDVLIG